MATLNVIRRWALRDQMSIREISRRTGLARNTVKKYLRSEETEPRYERRGSSSKLDPYAEKLATWLGIEATKSRKQRRTLRQIHTRRKPRTYPHREHLLLTKSVGQYSMENSGQTSVQFNIKAFAALEVFVQKPLSAIFLFLSTLEILVPFARLIQRKLKAGLLPASRSQNRRFFARNGIVQSLALPLCAGRQVNPPDGRLTLIRGPSSQRLERLGHCLVCLFLLNCRAFDALARTFIHAPGGRGIHYRGSDARVIGILHTFASLAFVCREPGLSRAGSDAGGQYHEID